MQAGTLVSSGVGQEGNGCQCRVIAKRAAMQSPPLRQPAHQPGCPPVQPATRQMFCTPWLVSAGSVFQAAFGGQADLRSNKPSQLVPKQHATHACKNRNALMLPSCSLACRARSAAPPTATRSTAAAARGVGPLRVCRTRASLGPRRPSMHSKLRACRAGWVRRRHGLASGGRAAAAPAAAGPTGATAGPAAKPA